MLQGFDQLPAPFRVVQQILLQVGVALHHPDVAEHFVEHARRPIAILTAGFGLGQL